MNKIDELKDQALDSNIPILKDDGVNFIVDYIKKNNIKSILEIGSAVGYSAINFASVSQDIKVLTIERDVSRYNEAIKNVASFGLENQIKIENADALLFETNEKFDLIFIDAAKSQYTKFFLKYQDNLNDNGVIITDNLSFHGMVEDITKTHNRNTKQLVRKIQSYISFLEENNEFETTFYDIGDRISVSKKRKN